MSTSPFIAGRNKGREREKERSSSVVQRHQHWGRVWEREASYLDGWGDSTQKRRRCGRNLPSALLFPFLPFYLLSLRAQRGDGWVAPRDLHATGNGKGAATVSFERGHSPEANYLSKCEGTLREGTDEGKQATSVVSGTRSGDSHRATFSLSSLPPARGSFSSLTPSFPPPSLPPSHLPSCSVSARTRRRRADGRSP